MRPRKLLPLIHYISHNGVVLEWPSGGWQVFCSGDSISITCSTFILALPPAHAHRNKGSKSTKFRNKMISRGIGSDLSQWHVGKGTPDPIGNRLG